MTPETRMEWVEEGILLLITLGLTFFEADLCRKHVAKSSDEVNQWKDKICKLGHEREWDEICRVFRAGKRKSQAIAMEGAATLREKLKGS